MLIRQLFSWLISLLPDVDLPPSILTSFSKLYQVAGFVNHYIPVDTFLSCLYDILLCSVLFIVISSLLKLL